MTNTENVPDPMAVVRREAISVVRKINPGLSGIDAIAAADELVRFTGAFIALVGKGVEDVGVERTGVAGYYNSREENARWEAVMSSGKSIVSAAEDISLTMVVVGPRCPRCYEYGDDGACVR